MPVPALCPHLQPLLAAELAAGNRVKDQGAAPGSPTGQLVLLRDPFTAVPAAVTAPLRRNDIDDPHWWKTEYACAEHGDVLACGFLDRSA